jgi:hypothetical protein
MTLDNEHKMQLLMDAYRKVYLADRKLTSLFIDCIGDNPLYGDADRHRIGEEGSKTHEARVRIARKMRELTEDELCLHCGKPVKFLEREADYDGEYDKFVHVDEIGYPCTTEQTGAAAMFRNLLCEYQEKTKQEIALVEHTAETKSWNDRILSDRFLYSDLSVEKAALSNVAQKEYHQYENYCKCLNCGFVGRGGEFNPGPGWVGLDEHDDDFSPCPRCREDHTVAASKEEVKLFGIPVEPDSPAFATMEEVRAILRKDSPEEIKVPEKVPKDMI